MTTRSKNYRFVMPSFGRGASRVLDLGATAARSSYLEHKTPEAADARAIAGDWVHVGAQLRAAVDAYDDAHAGAGGK